MAGIGRIEQKVKAKQDETDQNIAVAFQDLKQLCNMAKQMTELSKSIASKIKDVSSDETVQFRSHLLELGIESQIDLPSKSSYSSNNKYYRDLAQQIAKATKHFMDKDKQDQITLSDIYCRFNRLRISDHLVSPDDILTACRQMDDMPELGMKLVRYRSGLLVIQNQFYNDQMMVDKTVQLVTQDECMTPLQLSSILQIPIRLARQRLEDAETGGFLCRDESIEGLKFYPNKFKELAL